MDDAAISDLRSLFDDIYACRECRVVPSIVRRTVLPSWTSDLVLMAQAPSEHGVRVSGVHWLDAHGNLRPPGGTYLDSYLRRIGFSIDPQETTLPRPYTTNVLHCWPGRGGKRDRSPRAGELRNCSKWWKTELQLLRPKAIVLLGGPAAEAFARACNAISDFPSMLRTRALQRHLTASQSTTSRFRTLPHPIRATAAGAACTTI